MMMKKDKAGRVMKMPVELISLLIFLILTYLLSQRLGSSASERDTTRRHRIDQSRESEKEG
jgi:hypothetical protein